MSGFSRSLAAQAAAKCVVDSARQLELLNGPIATAPVLAEAEKTLIIKMMAEVKRRSGDGEIELQPDEVSSLFTFVFAKAAEVVTNMFNHQENKFELNGMLDGKIPIYADDRITAEFKQSEFPFTCARNYLDWYNETGELLGDTDPVLLLFEALKWCFRLSCHLAVSIVEKKDD